MEVCTARLTNLRVVGLCDCHCAQQPPNNGTDHTHNCRFIIWSSVGVGVLAGRSSKGAKRSGADLMSWACQRRHSLLVRVLGLLLHTAAARSVPAAVSCQHPLLRLVDHLRYICAVAMGSASLRPLQIQPRERKGDVAPQFIPCCGWQGGRNASSLCFCVGVLVVRCQRL